MNYVEIWKDIPGLNGYQVSTLGRIRSFVMYRGVTEWRFRKLSKDINGYLRFSVRGKSYLIHRLVLTVFRGEQKPGMVTRHLDNNKLNNNIDNLVYGTQAENAMDTVLAGCHSCKRKLTLYQANEIRDSYASGSNVFQLVRKYSLSSKSIRDILANKTYKT